LCLSKSDAGIRIVFQSISSTTVLRPYTYTNVLSCVVTLKGYTYYNTARIYKRGYRTMQPNADETNETNHTLPAPDNARPNDNEVTTEGVLEAFNKDH